ncbi:unnamed protein product [Diplocarpon coronariae]
MFETAEFAEAGLSVEEQIDEALWDDSDDEVDEDKDDLERLEKTMRKCDDCGKDYTTGDSDEDGPYGPFDDVEEDTNVLVLEGSSVKFVPQLDQQLLGAPVAHKNQQRTEYGLPVTPRPLSSLETTYCETCHLTWLVGEAGELGKAKEHPCHRNHTDTEGTSRSILVYVASFRVCNGPKVGGIRNGFGLFFGLGSKYNIQESVILESSTKQKTELTAIIRALEVVHSNILPARRDILVTAVNGDCAAALSDATALRVIIVTSHEKIVDVMCFEPKEGKENEGLTITSSHLSSNIQQNSIDKNSRLKKKYPEYQLLKRKATELHEDWNTTIQYHYVQEDDNKDATMLARRATSYPPLDSDPEIL